MNGADTASRESDKEVLFRLRRFSTEYLPKEDRIRLLAELKDSQSLVIWLTQRMLNQLLPPLFRWLESHGPNSVQAEVIQSLRQEAARAALEPQAPVRVAAQSQDWLLVAADIKTTARIAHLRFKGADAAQQATLDLGVKPLRQWLNILHDQYRKAGWTRTSWPQWVTEVTAVEVAKQAPLLH